MTSLVASNQTFVGARTVRAVSLNLPWCLWFIALSALMFLQIHQTLSVITFIAATLIYALCRPNRALDVIGNSVFLWPFLLWISLSLLWSQDPDWTLRQIGETYLTVVAAVLMALSLRPKSFISVTMCCCLVATVATALYLRGNLLLELRTGYPMQGIFLGSKNSFGGVEAISILAGVWIVADSSRSALARLFMLPIQLVAAVLLYASKSAAATTALLLAVIVSLVAFCLGRFSRRERALIIVVLLFVSVILGLVALLYGNELLSEYFNITGKDASLSDRTILWDWAKRAIIPAHPLFGVGYRAFWVESNPYAEELVRILGIGWKIHFHNQWYELAVELGYVGLSISLVTFLVVMIGIMRWAIQIQSPESCFYLGLAAYTAIRTYVEVDLFGPFMFGFVMLIVGYVHAQIARKNQMASLGSGFAA